jgi:hypothetical protein
MRVEIIVRRVLAAGEAGVAVAVLVCGDSGARRLQPQPWRWPWNRQTSLLILIKYVYLLRSSMAPRSVCHDVRSRKVSNIGQSMDG